MNFWNKLCFRLGLRKAKISVISDTVVKNTDCAECPTIAPDATLDIDKEKEFEKPCLPDTNTSVEESAATVKELAEQSKIENPLPNEACQFDASPVVEDKPLFSEMLLREEFLGITTDLYLFIQDRTERLSELDDNDIQWIIGSVDFLDELRIMSGSYTPKDIIAVDLIRNLLLEKLTVLEAELIDSDEWNPAQQRAISVTRDENVKQETILRKGGTGIIVSGKLIRKQEVILLIPKK